MDLKGSSHGLACSSRASCSGCGLCFSVNWQGFNPSYFCFNVQLKTGDTCRMEVSNSQEHIPVAELGLRVSVPPSVPLTALPAQGDSPELTPCSRTASSLSHQLQADQKTHFHRECWEWEPALPPLLTQVCELFPCRKSQPRARDDDAAQGARFMPAHALEQNALPHYKFWLSPPEAKSCWNIYQCAVTWQSPEGRVLYLKLSMIKILGWHMCNIWKLFCHSH